MEPEIAFLIGKDLEPPATVTSMLEVTEAVFAAVEVLDSRYEDFRFRLPDVIADNASAGRIVLGPRARPRVSFATCACWAACCAPRVTWRPPQPAGR